MKELSVIFVLFVLCANQVLAQDSLPDTIEHQWNLFQQTRYQEKIFVHADRPGYVAGETMWYRVYCVEGVHHTPSRLSKVAYVELVDEAGEVQCRGKILLNGPSGGNASFTIPATAPSGLYTLRAYTQWMRNFNEDFFYQESIIVVNTSYGLNPAPAPSGPLYDIQFFPEGGSWVYGIECRMGFRIVNRLGYGIPANGYIMDGHDTLLHFTPQRHGLGSFVMTPQAGRAYRSVILDQQGRQFETALPEPQPTGFVMRVQEEAGAGMVQVHMMNNEEAKEGYLFIHTRGSGLVRQKVTFENGRSTNVVSLQNFPDGIAHITFFDHLNRPRCERLFFVMHKKLKTNLSMTRKQGVPRELMHGELSSEKKFSWSVAVYKIDSLNRRPLVGVTSFLLLTSELGPIEGADYYVSDEATSQERDHVMLTHGWRKFSWHDVLAAKQFRPSFIPEINGPLLTGRVTTSDTTVVDKGDNVYIATSGMHPHLYVTQSASSGDFVMQLQHNGNLQAWVQSGSGAVIEPASAYAPVRRSPKHLVLSKQIESSLAQRSLYAQVDQAFRQQQSTAPAQTDASIPSFLGQADKWYRLDDYVRFSTVEEILREYVKEVAVRKSDGHYRLLILNQQSNAFFKDAPLILVDGLPMLHTDNFMKLDPHKIKEMHIVTNRFYYGGLAYDGILYCESFDRQLGEQALDGLPRTTVEGWTSGITFFQPLYKIKASLPDTRNLIYWNPDISSTADKNGMISFSAPDIPGTYQIVINGLSLDGTPATHYQRFEIRNVK